MPHATFSSPDLDAFCGLDGLGLTATGQHIETGQAVLECRVLADDQWCHRCGQAGVPRGTVLRTIVHVPLGWRPTMLQVRVRRYRCPDCCTVWRQDTTAAAASRTKLSRNAVFWALKSVVIDRMSIARVAENLGTAWHTVNDAVLE
ncbi:ISL3 family transposase, partial [Brachybacterium alimentarium]